MLSWHAYVYIYNYLTFYIYIYSSHYLNSDNINAALIWLLMRLQEILAQILTGSHNKFSTIK
jgi:hypothetical protein